MAKSARSNLPTAVLRITKKIRQSLNPLPDDIQTLVAAALYARVQEDFFGCVMLARKGLIDSACTLIRTISEYTIAIAATAADPGFPRKILSYDYKSLRASLRDDLTDPELRALYSDDVIRELQAMFNECEARHEKPIKLNWHEVAEGVGLKKWCYHAHYRTMSCHSHVSYTSIDRMVVFNEAGKPTGISLTPNSTGLQDTLNLACEATLLASDTICRLLRLSRLRARVNALEERVLRSN